MKKTFKQHTKLIIMLIYLLLHIACVNNNPTIEITGTWNSNFNSTLTIVDQQWTEKGVDYEIQKEIIEYNNEQDVAITQNMENQKFNKERWVIENDTTFRHCTIAFNQDSIEDARNFDESNLDTTNLSNGCSGSPFTQYTKQ